jgi:plasmid stabilization system protein ParE
VRIVYTPRALRDIDEALDYITADSVRAAKRLLVHLEDMIEPPGLSSGPPLD